MQSAFSDLGVPLAPDKIIGPTQIITYLGIEIDSVDQCIRLPPDKLCEIRSLLTKWHTLKKCTKRELLSLIGSLSFACKVVKPGRIFLRRLIDLSTTVDKLSHHIYLNSEAKADIEWWLEFLPSWNGIAIFQEPVTTSNSLQLFTDSSRLGLGAVFGNQWISMPWPESCDYHINFLELFAILAAVYTWGTHWAGQQIILYTDNQSLTYIWSTGSCKNKDIMRLIRAIFLFTAKHNTNLLLHHIQGHKNCLADALSRLQVKKFFKAHPTCAKLQSTLPPEVWDLF